MSTRVKIAAAVLAAQAVAFGTGYVFYERANLAYPTEDSYSVEYRDGRVHVNPQDDREDPYTWADQLRAQPAYTYTTDRGTVARMPDGETLYRDLTPLRRSQTAQGWYLVVLPYGRTLHRQATSQGDFQPDDLEVASRTLVMHYRSAVSSATGAGNGTTQTRNRAYKE